MAPKITSGSLRNLESEAAHQLDIFDVARARGLKARQWLTFLDHPGLRLVRHGKARTFVYRFVSPVDGRLRQIRIGRWPATSWPQAQVRWENLRKLRDAGQDPRLERRTAMHAALEKLAAARQQAQLDKVTVAWLVERYLADKVEQNRKPDGAAKVRRLLMATIVAKFSDRPAAGITRVEAATFLVAERGRAPQQTLIFLREARAMWRFAIASGLLPERTPNVWTLTSARDLGLRHEPRSRALNDPEVATLLVGLGAVPQPQSDALRFLLLVGCRSGEACGIKADDVVDGVWHLTEPKTGTVRNIILSRQAREIVERHPKGFSGMTPWHLADVLRAAAHFGLPPFVVHDLRRTMRTGLARLDERDEIAEAALGHKPPGIVGTYNVHKFERKIGEALQKWADHLDALRTPKVRPMQRRA